MKKFSTILLAIILVIAVFLRVYGIGTNYYFSGELGKELLYMWKYVNANTLPLTGMATSHEWLSYGPFYYWLMIPVYKIFSGNPFILFWSALSVSFIGLALNWTVVKKIAEQKVAVISTLIATFSPLLIWQTRNSKLHVFFFILSPLLMYGLSKIWDGKIKWLFWTGLIFGLMFSFHFSQIPLIIVFIALFYIKKNLYKLKDWLLFGLGVLIPNISLIWQDKSLALWVPYRVINFVDKNPASTFQSLIEYFGRNMFWNSSIWIFGLVLSVLAFGLYVLQNRKKLTREFLPFYLVSTIAITVVANILHGAPPVHYFLPIFTTLPILFAVILENYKYWYLLVGAIFLVNLAGYFSFEKPDDYMPLYKQEAVTDFIIADSGGNPLSVKRIGPYDHFPENYAQNYMYLILWKGGNLVDSSSHVYTITELGENINVQK